MKFKTTILRSPFLIPFILMMCLLINGPSAVAQNDLPSTKDCPPIVFVKRPHFDRPFGIGTIIGWDIYKPGGGIYVCDPKYPKRSPQEIWRRDEGVIFDMSLSFDAKKLLFAWRKCSVKSNTKDPVTVSSGDTDCFHIYEINVDGTGLRQLTRGPFQDIHPFFLPNGQIGMVSTRVKGYTMCQPGAACALYVMDSNGHNMQRIHFGTLADHSPHVLDNGAILFTRWEYQDKDLTYLQGLWTINPDGTTIQLFYGNTLLEPAVIWQAKPMPGSSKLLCTLAPHHGNPVGAVGIIDRALGLENPQGIRNLTPEIDYNPQRNARGPGDRSYAQAYRDPYPIRADLFVVSHCAADVKRYQLYLMNDQGQKQLLYGDAKLSSFNALPLLARKPPHSRPSVPESDDPSGAFYVSDVYQGLTGIDRGQVKALRIMTVPPKTCNMRGQRAYDMDPIMGRGTYYAKVCLGTVAVSERGSAYFRAPAGIELYFQALDSTGQELCRMGSITQLVPGETQSCIGCHEPRFMAPPSAASADTALQGEPDEIRAPAWGAGPVDFVRQVQPVLDRYCVNCHQGIDPEGGIDLSDDKTRFFNMAYDHLTEKRLIDFQWLLNEALVRSFRPLESGARVSKLVKMIEAQHGDVNVDLESRQRIYTWIEANVPYYGTYQHTRPGTPGSRDACSGPWFETVTRIYSRHCARCHGKDFYTNNSPRHHTWINLTHPERSRLLHAPLAQAAGGLARCQNAEGKPISVFATPDAPERQALLKAIRQGNQALYAQPRMDMDRAVAVPFPTDHAGPFNSFAGP